ncbi:hypothetical protein D3C85_712450 [compost metagenome]
MPQATSRPISDPASAAAAADRELINRPTRNSPPVTGLAWKKTWATPLNKPSTTVEAVTTPSTATPWGRPADGSRSVDCSRPNRAVARKTAKVVKTKGAVSTGILHTLIRLSMAAITTVEQAAAKTTQAQVRAPGCRK